MSWSIGTVVGLLVAIGVWWFTRQRAGQGSVAIGLMAGAAVVLLLVYGVPQIQRWRAVERLQEAEKDLVGLRAQVAARAEENSRLLTRAQAAEQREAGLKRQIEDRGRRDRELAARRQALDQVVIPPAKHLEAPDEILAMFQRYGQAWRTPTCGP